MDSQSAKASYKHDEDRIKALIEGSLGFEGVNAKIKLFLLKWIAFQVQEYMGQLVEGSPDDSVTLDESELWY